MVVENHGVNFIKRWCCHGDAMRISHALQVGYNTVSNALRPGKKKYGGNIYELAMKLAIENNTSVMALMNRLKSFPLSPDLVNPTYVLQEADYVEIRRWLLYGDILRIANDLKLSTSSITKIVHGRTKFIPVHAILFILEFVLKNKRNIYISSMPDPDNGWFGYYQVRKVR